MRTFLSLSIIILITTANIASAADLSIRFEARGLGSDVQWSDVANGFILDVYLEATTPMVSAGISVLGDSGFQHAGTVDGGIEGILNYQRDQGWSNSAFSAETFGPGTLPLGGGSGSELGTICTSSETGATRLLNSIPA